MDCPRQYFFRHILGWESDEPNIHLEFGSAVHKAMEHLLINGYGADSILDAFELFVKHYRSIFPPELDEINAPKIPSNVLRALPLYCKFYNEDMKKFKVLHTEVAGVVLIGDNRKIYFKTDSIIDEKDEGIMSLEHKTTGRMTSSWAKQWPQKIQVGTYTHVLNCMYKEAYCVKINAIVITNPPKMKKDGVTPYANARDCEFRRIPLRKSMSMMDDWLYTINFWYDWIEAETDKILTQKEDDNIMTVFPKRTENCSNYFGCPYADYCQAWPNPLRKCKEPPVGFKVAHWDPSELEKEAREVVEL